MNCQLIPLEPMRTTIQLAHLCAPRLRRQYLRPNGFAGHYRTNQPTGASNLEDGIQIAHRNVLHPTLHVYGYHAYCSADAELNWGGQQLPTDVMKYLSERCRGGLVCTPIRRRKVIQPWIGLGTNYMQQSNFADLADAEGNAAYLSDGKVYNMAEDLERARTCSELTPDYTYESQTATQRNVAVPIRMGVNLNLTPRSTPVLLLFGRSGSR